MVALPFFILVFFYLGLSPLLISISMLILISEHVITETTRYKIASGNALSAILINFCRQASWAPLVVISIELDYYQANVQTILGFWLVMNFLILVNLFKNSIIPRMKILTCKFAGLREHILSSYLVGKKVITSGLSMRALFTIDKVLVVAFFDSVIASQYMFHSAIAFALIPLFDATIVAHNFKRVTSIKHNFHWDLLSSMMKKNYFFAISISFFLYCCLIYIIPFLSKQMELAESYNLGINFNIIFLAAIFSILGSISHQILFIFKRDNEIILANITALASVFFFAFLFIYIEKENSIQTAILISFGLQFALKHYFCTKIKNLT